MVLWGVSPSGLLELEQKQQALVPLPALQALVEAIYAIDVTDWEDENFARLELIIERAITHVVTLPTADQRPLMERLLAAKEGAEQGLSPDPAKRPSIQEIRDYVSAHLD